VVEQAQSAGVGKMQSGVELGVVHAAQRETLEQYGFGHLVCHRTGYAVGIGFPPTWGPNSWTDIVAGNKTQLAPGMVFHLVLYAFEPAKFGLALGQTILITEHGPEILTNAAGGRILYA
jgi:Xaa-Pro aminopeptidase